MISRLYTGWVAHERTTPARNTFRYPIYYLGLDLSELDELDHASRVFAHNGPGLVSLWDRDHGARDGSPLQPWIEALLAEVGVDLAGGRVMLLTFPRVLGARFYPVSFWYCFSADGQPRAVLAEVHNTVHERHNYLLHNHGAPFDWNSRPNAVKAFWVSPFMPIDGVHYEFAFSEPAEELAVQIRDFVGDTLTLTAAIDLSAQPLTDRGLLGTVVRHGPISVVAFARILWQALRLITKRVPIQKHRTAPAEETSR